MSTTNDVTHPSAVRETTTSEPQQKQVTQAEDDRNGDPPPDGQTNGQQDDAPDQQGPPAQRRSELIKGKVKDQKEKIKAKAQPPGGFDATPLPDAPPGYTVKFTFHRAANLPISDYGSRSTDPFIEATLTTSLPKRHQEDPDLTHRTQTLRRDKEPAWEEEWVVANVPSSGFKLKCRLYDEDWPDHNDRLGNVTIIVDHVDEKWSIRNEEFQVKKRVGSKRAYLLKAATSALRKGETMTPSLFVSAEVLGKSDPPHGQVWTIGPTTYFRHFSPVIGRIAGVQVMQNEADDVQDHPSKDENAHRPSTGDSKKTQKYDFQAVEIQLAGPVPTKLYHRYVEFRPLIGMMFTSKGLRGHILHKALHSQHRRIYAFNKNTQWGSFKPCSEEASLQFLKMVHFDQGGRIFTYVLTLDGLFRFTETGKEFGIDLLSKHTMHSDVATYIACSGEFFVRRLKKPTASEAVKPDQPTHPTEEIPGGPPKEPPPEKPEYYQLVIDNDSGTYRPDKSTLPELHKFLEKNFPGLGIVTLSCDDDEDQKLKDKQRAIKKKEGRNVRMVQNRSPSASSFSSSDISDLEEMERSGEAGHKSKKERMFDALEQDNVLKGFRNEARPDQEAGGPSSVQ